MPHIKNMKRMPGCLQFLRMMLTFALESEKLAQNLKEQTA